MSTKVDETLSSKLGRAIDSFMNPINQRMSNPLIGSFIISWAVLNWQPIIFFILSKQNVEGKILHIKDFFYNDNWLWGYGFHNWCMYFLFPLLVSCLYVWLIPRLENLVDMVNKDPIDSKIERKHNEKISNYKKLKEIATEDARVEEAKSQFKTLEEKNKEITFLNDQVESLREQEITYKQQAASFINNLNESNNENTVLKSENIQLKNSYTNFPDVIRGILNRVLRSSSLRELSSIEEGLLLLLEDNELYDNKTKESVFSAIKDSRLYIESTNSFFVLIISGNFDTNEKYNTVKKIVKSLLEVNNMMILKESNSIEVVCRFKYATDTFEMYDFIIANISFVESVSLRNISSYRNGANNYNSQSEL